MKTTEEIKNDKDSKAACSDYRKDMYRYNFDKAETAVKAQLENAPENVKAQIMDAFDAAIRVAYNPDNGSVAAGGMAADLRQHTMRIAQNMGIKGA